MKIGRAAFTNEVKFSAGYGMPGNELFVGMESSKLSCAIDVPNKTEIGGTPGSRLKQSCIAIFNCVGSMFPMLCDCSSTSVVEPLTRSTIHG